MTKGSIHQEDKVSLHVYVPNKNFDSYRTEMLKLRGEINKSIVVIGYSYICLSISDRIDRISIKI